MSVKSSTIAAVLLMSVPAVAQELPGGVPQPPGNLLDFVRREGGIHFCLNSSSVLAPFDRAVGEALAGAMLTDHEFNEIVDLDGARPLDFRITVEDVDLFVQVSNKCDALLGFYIPDSGVQPWLTITMPYYATRMVLATRDPAIGSLGDVPPGERVGSLIGNRGDAAFLTYLSTQADGARARRIPYSGNDDLLRRLEDGTLAAALVWEPALWLATDGDPEGAGYHVADLPFTIPPLEFGIALPSDQLFLRTALDSAIAALRAEAMIAAIAADFGLPAR